MLNIVIKKYYFEGNNTILELNFMGKDVSLKFPMILGKHQALDLVGAVIMAHFNGCPIKEIKRMLPLIQLPKYRFVKQKINDIEVVTDFCGHYAGIENNITQLRYIYPDKKLSVIFQPVSYVRMKKTADLVCKALRKADFVYICDIFPLRESHCDVDKLNFSCKDLIARIPNSRYYNKIEDLFFDKTKDVVAIFAPFDSDVIEEKICCN